MRGRLFKRNRNVAAASLCSDREESKEINISTSLSSQPLSVSQISYFPLVKPAEKLEGKGVQLLLALQLGSSGQSTREGGDRRTFSKEGKSFYLFIWFLFEIGTYLNVFTLKKLSVFISF